MQEMPFDPSTADLEQGYDPALEHITPDQPASEEEERMLGEATISTMEYLYSDEGLASVTNVLKQDDRELFEKIPDIALPLLQRAKGDHPEADAAVFFGGGGLIQIVADALLELAAQEGLPGANDEQQQQAVIINLYRKVGEFISETGDEDSVSEAQNLGMNMALTQPDGSIQSPSSFQMKPDKIGDSVRQGLLQ